MNSEKVALLNRGESYIKLIHPDQIKAAKSGGFTVTCDYKKTNDVDVIILCLPTPLTADNEPDLSYILCALDSLKPHLRISRAFPGEHYVSWHYRRDSKKVFIGLGNGYWRELFLVLFPRKGRSWQSKLLYTLYSKDL